jgi:hypothetical protein
MSNMTGIATITEGYRSPNEKVNKPRIGGLFTLKRPCRHVPSPLIRHRFLFVVKQQLVNDFVFLRPWPR